MSQPRHEHRRQWQQGRWDEYQNHSGVGEASQQEDMGDQRVREEDVARGVGVEDGLEDYNRPEEGLGGTRGLEGWSGCYLDQSG